jgi:hypothetical protein
LHKEQPDRHRHLRPEGEQTHREQAGAGPVGDDVENGAGPALGARPPGNDAVEDVADPVRGVGRDQ